MGGKHVFLVKKRFISGKNFVLDRILRPCLVLAIHVLWSRERKLSVSLLLTRTLADKQHKIILFGRLKTTQITPLNKNPKFFGHLKNHTKSDLVSKFPKHLKTAQKFCLRIKPKIQNFSSQEYL